MKNAQTWAPTKFVLERGRLRASHNPKEISAGSRLGADLVADSYHTHAKNHCRGRLLDLGCGKVPFYGLYREYVSENVCVDWHNSAHGNDHLDTVRSLKGSAVCRREFRHHTSVRRSRAYTNARSLVAGDGQIA
jgi:hypothetical protein